MNPKFYCTKTLDLLEKICYNEHKISLWRIISMPRRLNRSDMTKIAKKILRMITSLIVLLAVVFAFLVVGIRLFGVDVYTVLSPSMEPEYKTGSLLYVKEVDPSTLSVNDVITFQLTDNITATHRIIEIIEDEQDASVKLFRTKGDANDLADDAPVSCDRIVGQPVFCIPYLGYAASYIQQPPGSYAALAIGAAIVFLVLLIDLLTGERDNKQSPTKEPQRKESDT